jgi:hypothetical protein
MLCRCLSAASHTVAFAAVDHSAPDSQLHLPVVRHAQPRPYVCRRQSLLLSGPLRQSRPLLERITRGQASVPRGPKEAPSNPFLEKSGTYQRRQVCAGNGLTSATPTPDVFALSLHAPAQRVP